MEIKNEYFRLKLSSDWKPLDSTDPEQFLFRSVIRDADLTVSYLLMDARGRDLSVIANKLLEFRFQAERSLDSLGQVYLSEPWGTQHDNGVIQINYMGRDDTNRYFFFSAFVSETHTVNIYGQIANGTQKELEKFYQVTLSNLGF